MSAEKRVIKKYPNRRLYDTAISAYITVADVKNMILDYTDVQVNDAKTGEDITRQVLLQILLEEEAGGAPLFGNDMICQFIRLYGQKSQAMLVPFLEQNMRIFQQWQQSMKEQLDTPLSWAPPVLPGLQGFTEWQQQLQEQTALFWHNLGLLPKKGSGNS